MNQRALIVGYGSIGRRHAKILSELGFTLDLISSQSNTGFNTFKNYSNIENINKYSYVIIATPTFQHENDLVNLRRLEYQGKVFVEKPLSLTGDFEHNFEALLVGYNLRFLESLNELKKRIEGQKIFVAESYAGSHLESWRKENGPNYSYLKSLGGGVLKDLSHEIDYLTWIFEDLDLLWANGNRIAEVTIDSDDSWKIIASSRLVKQISISLNYFDKLPTRILRVVTEKETHLVNLIDNSIHSSSSGIIKFEDDISSTYFKMHKAILSDPNNPKIAKLNDAIKIDSFINKCFQSVGWLV